MSDRRKRDVGRKREHQQNKHDCDCWYCMDGGTKKKIRKQREDRKEIQRELGYSRVGLKNI